MKIDNLMKFDQGRLRSFTTNGIAQAKQKNTKNKTTISRLCQYFDSLLLEGNTQAGSGCSKLDALKALKLYKYIDESLYHYVTIKFNSYPPVNILY